MAGSVLRSGIAGCDTTAPVHSEWPLALGSVRGHAKSAGRAGVPHGVGSHTSLDTPSSCPDRDAADVVGLDGERGRNLGEGHLLRFWTGRGHAIGLVTAMPAPSDHGEPGRIRGTRPTPVEDGGGADGHPEAPPWLSRSVAEDLVWALPADIPLCCPIEEALESVRHLEAMGRAAATGQVVRPRLTDGAGQ
jgi:hypothetical protein